jgi:F-type H+-transporting ATPase subunit delta
LGEESLPIPFRNGEDREENVIPSAALGRYAKSLADVAFEEEIEQEVTGNLETYNQIFQAVPDILEAFHSPAIPRETKEKLLTELMVRHPVHPIASNFLRILLQHNRIRYFPQILKSYLKAVSERKGIVLATVSTASPLSRQELESLTGKLTGITGKSVNIELKTDASLLGGIVIQVGSTVFDGSIRARLNSVKRCLSEN